MQIKTFPHEFLARWGRDGKLQGYHVVPVQIVCDDAGNPLKNADGSNQFETFGEATTLERAGLLLPDLLSDGLAQSLQAVDRYKARIATLESEALVSAERIAALETEVLALSKPV